MLYLAMLATLIATSANAQTTTVVFSPIFSTTTAPVTSALGVAQVVYDATAKTLNVKAKITGISGAVDLTEFIFTSSGNAVPENPMNFASVTSSGGQTFSAISTGFATSLLNGDLTIRIKTAANPTGELGGPILWGTGGVAVISSSQIVGNTVSSADMNGYGLATVGINSANTLFGSFRLFGISSGNLRAVQIRGPADVGSENGDTFAWCTATTSAFENQQTDFSCQFSTVTDTFKTALLAGQYYFEVYSILSPQGAMRGQIIFPSTLDYDQVYMAALRSNPVSTTSMGNGMVIFYKGISTRGVAAFTALVPSPVTGATMSSPGNSPTSPARFSVALQGRSATAHQPFLVTEAQSNAIKSGNTDGTGAFINVTTAASPSGAIVGLINARAPSSGSGAVTVSAVALALASVAVLAAFAA